MKNKVIKNWNHFPLFSVSLSLTTHNSVILLDSQPFDQNLWETSVLLQHLKDPLAFNHLEAMMQKQLSKFYYFIKC